MGSGRCEYEFTQSTGEKSRNLGRKILEHGAVDCNQETKEKVNPKFKLCKTSLMHRPYFLFLS